jgi:hypothetical protein
MRFPVALLLGIILLLVLGYYVVVDIALKKRDEGRKEEERRMINTEEAEVTRLTISRTGGSSVTIERSDGDEWKITSPVHADADRYEVARIIDTLVEAKIERRFLVAREEWKAMDLLSPDIVLETESADGSADTLYAGGLNPTGALIYSRRAGSDSVYLLRAEVRSAIDKGTFELREKRLFTVDVNRVKSFCVHTYDSVVRCEKSGECWTITHPSGYDAGEEEIRSYLVEATAVRAREFVPAERVSPDAAGLSRPSLRILIQGAAGEFRDALTEEIMAGGNTADGTTVFVQKAGMHELMKVDAFDVENLKVDVDRFRRRLLYDFQTGDIIVVTISSDEDEFECGRDERNIWRLTRPEPRQCNEASIMNIITGMKFLRVREFIADDVDDLSPYGLDSRSRSVVLSAPDTSYTLILGSKKDYLVYATDGKGKSVYALPDYLAERFDVTWESLVEPEETDE